MSATPDVVPVAPRRFEAQAELECGVQLVSVANGDLCLYVEAKAVIDALQARIDELETQLFIEKAEPALFEQLGLPALPAFPSVRPNQIESKS